MRVITSGLVVASIVGVVGGSVMAQTSRPQQFTGIKLVDPQNPRGLETDITVRVDKDQLVLVEPRSKKEVRSLAYSNITSIDETFSITPPLPAGEINRASTGSTSMPSYLGREPRRWWTINSDGAPVILRVSNQIYDRLKAAVTEHKLTIQNADEKKKK